MVEIKIKILEVRDSFHPERILEYKPVYDFGEGVIYDFETRQIGYSLTGKTFRSSYSSLIELCPKPVEKDAGEWEI